MGEGLLIHEGKPYWLDIETRDVFLNHQRIRLEDDIPSVIFQADETGLLIGTHRGIKKLSGDNQLSLVCALPDHDPEKFRLNDGCLLRDGALLVGSMSRTNPDAMPGAIYRLDKTGTVTRFDWPCHIPNSFVELPDGDVLISDSLRQTVFKVQLDGADLKATVWYQASGAETPDGGCLLPNGNIALAMWDGGCVRIFDLGGRIEDDLRVPVLRPTNCKYDAASQQLFLTSSSSVAGSDGMCDKPSKSGYLLSIALEI